jgi:hypothetical protein
MNVTGKNATGPHWGYSPHCSSKCSLYHLSERIYVYMITVLELILPLNKNWCMQNETHARSCSSCKISVTINETPRCDNP